MRIFYGSRFFGVKVKRPDTDVVLYFRDYVFIMNYIDVRLSLKKRFDKEQYEQTADYLIGELALREKRIDNILSKLASENILIKQALGKNGERNAKAA